MKGDRRCTSRKQQYMIIGEINTKEQILAAGWILYGITNQNYNQCTAKIIGRLFRATIEEKRLVDVNALRFFIGACREALDGTTLYNLTRCCLFQESALLQCIGM